MARTGEEYLKGLQDGRDLWLDGERVTDVTQHPQLAAAARTMAGYYDLHWRDAQVCLMPHPDTAMPMSISHLIPRSTSDLLKRHAETRICL